MPSKNKSVIWSSLISAPNWRACDLLKGKHEIAYAVGEEAISSGLEYKKIFNNGKADFTLAELMLSEYCKKVEIKIL